MTEVNFDFEPDETFHNVLNGTPPPPLQLKDVFKSFVVTQRATATKIVDRSAYCTHFKIDHRSINQGVINGNGDASFNILKEALNNINDYKIEMRTTTGLTDTATIRPSRNAVRGPQGDKGSAGERGAPGAQGAAGARGDTGQTYVNPNCDLACFTYDELKQNFNINRIVKYEITLKPDFKQNAVRKPRENLEQMKTNLVNIIEGMKQNVMKVVDSPIVDSPKENVLSLSSKDYYLFIWSLFIGDPLHDYQHGYRNKKGGIKGISFGHKDPIANHVINFLRKKHEELIDEYKMVTGASDDDEFIKKFLKKWFQGKSKDDFFLNICIDFENFLG